MSRTRSDTAAVTSVSMFSRGSGPAKHGVGTYGAARATASALT